jgi:aspartyl-tRNA(Asn)/glutamyl-tRNA(Gln) amidotransferase subunit A
MYQKSLQELSQALSNKEISSIELSQFFLDRINRFNPKLNALITICEESALKQAIAADKILTSGNADPLCGIPLLHKDIFCTNNIKTTCGSKMLDNFIAPYDATVVEKLSTAGMVTLGKLNMDEFAMGSSNETSFYGPVKNPWDLERVPGGSSGGSAAAIAARLAPIATGTDTGGSIRQPASLCGITGLKPTYGRVSRWGMIAFASSLDQAGPMARSAQDAAMLLNAMAGSDEKDSTSLNLPKEDFCTHLNDDIKGLKIGLPKQFFNHGFDADVEDTIQSAIKTYQKMGAEIIEVDLPHIDLSIAAYYVIAPAECSSNLSRFDGVRFGYRCENPTDLQDLYKRSRSEAFGAEVKNRILIGTYALSAGYYDAYYIKAQKIRNLIKQDFKKAFEQVDVLLSPTSPTTAFKIGEKSGDPVSMYLSDIFTIGANLAGLPAMSLPCGFSESLPVGMQLIAPHLQEAKLLNYAHQYQLQSDWHLKVPEKFI